MATLRPNVGMSMSTPQPASPNTASLSPSPTSGYASPGSPSTTATSAAPTAMPSDDEVEAVIKQATSTRPTPDGRPPPGKDTRTQLFTGNLPYRVRWQDLKDLFRRAGTVLRADVSLSPDNRSRGYGTVLLASAEDAGRAVDMFNGYNWQGRVLEVRLDRLGAIPGADLDANPTAMLPGVGMSALSMGSANGLNGNLGALNGLHVPSPHPALSYVSQQAASPALLSAKSSLSSTATNASQSNSPLIALKPSLIALQQQRQQLQQEREREEFLMNQCGPGRPGLGGLDPYFGSMGRGLSVDIDREQSRSSVGMRNLFVGNLPFHCQWQDLKDLFRQAGTILRADVSLGPDGRSRGFGTVTFANEIDAECAVMMFNGFDFNGRVLKVHYDRFSASSPLPSTLSSHPSNLTTPVQPAASSTHAALLQAAQLQQLVSGQTFNRYSHMNSQADRVYNGNSSNDGNTAEASELAQTLRANMQILHDSLQMQPQSRPTTGSELSAERVRTRVTSEPSVSPFSIHLPGTSPSLAERRQKVPPPIGSISASSSRRSSDSGADAERRSANMTLSAGTVSAEIPSTSSASPTNNRRSVGHSLSMPSASSSRATTVESSSDLQRSATSSAASALRSTGTSTSTWSSKSAEPSSNQASHSSSATSSTSPRSSHPAHPGPISLPPPPPAGSFPLYSPQHHPMSPTGHPMSPPVYAGYTSYGPMSPMHAYPLPAHMHPHNMTPHGLPPITPSMPSFSFVPQPSPSVAAGGSSAIPPTPAEGAPPGSEGYAPSGQPGESSGNSMMMGMSMVPMMSPPMRLPHHVFQQFTPGATMSPGAFYGAPSRGSYLNPAVGSPVLFSSYGFPHPGSQPGSPYYMQTNGGPYGEEQSGYFPPVNPPPRNEGYFPPVSALGSSGLANEILRNGSSMNTDDSRPQNERNDSGSARTSSENGHGEDTDAERARSSSSGATSWRSSDGNASSASNAGATTSIGPTLESLAQDMASVRLGSPPKSRSTKLGGTSYAAVAASVDSKKGVQESPSRVDDVSGPVPLARQSSLGRESSEGARRPAAPQKTHSDETGAHVRLNAEASATL